MTDADLVLLNGKILTLWPECPWVTALAVGGEKVLAVGDDAEIQALAGIGTRSVDLGGRAAFPGLTDTHIHLLSYGLWILQRADLSGSRSVDEIIARLQAHASHSPGEWILGRGFDQEILAEKRFPTREELDQVSRERPVMITRLCGHACVANSKAIELAGAERLPDSARASGLMTEDDMGPVWEQVPSPTPAELTQAALLAANEARAKGITAVHCMVESMDELQVLRDLHSAGRLPIRFYVMPRYGLLDQLVAEGLRTGVGDAMLRIGAVKMFADGSMGARTAALNEDYADDPGNRGILLHSDEELAAMVRKVHRAGWQAGVHAIGDRAVEQAVGAIEAALEETGEDNSIRRHRVEHASLLSKSLIKRMAQRKIVATVQPQFVITDFWTANRVGRERYRWAYPFRTLLQAGVPMSFGSDCPVERLDSFELIYRAVTRDRESQAECLSVEEVIHIYASGGAYVSFEGNERGSLAPGRLADLVVTDRDIFTCPASEIADARADLVLVGGREA